MAARTRREAMLENKATTSERGGNPESWLNAPRFALLLGVLVLASYPKAVLGGGAFVVRDFGLFAYPVAHFFRESIWNGEFPLWNPYNCCGLPFLAQWNSMVLYPPSLLYLLLPLGWALNLFSLLHLYWGGLGMYFLARRWTQNAWAGGLAGIVFAFNGLSLSLLIWPSHIATMSWFPWMLLVFPPAWGRGGRPVVWAILAGSLQMLAGGPEVILLTWIALGACLGREWILARSSRWAMVLRFGGMGLAVALVSAPQLLPFLQLLLHSQRDTGFGASEWSMPAWGWANFLLPLFRTFATPQGIYFQTGQYWVTSYYLGAATIFLGLLALRRSPDRRPHLLAALIFAALWLALGDAGGLYSAARRLLPGLGYMRYPVKYVLLVAGLTPLLAGCGLATLSRRTGSIDRFDQGCAAALLFAMAVIAWLGWKYPTDAPQGEAFLRNCAARIVLALVLFLLLAAWLKADGRRRILMGSLLLIGFWLDFLTHVPNQNPTVAPSVYARDGTAPHRHWSPPPNLGNSRAMLAPIVANTLKSHLLPNLEQNLLLSRLALLADCNLLEDVPTVSGFYSLLPEHINNVLVRLYAETNRESPALLDFMGVSQLTRPGEYYEYAPRPGALPLVSAGQQPFFVDDRESFHALSLTNLNLRQVVLLPTEARSEIKATYDPSARILRSRFDLSRVSIEAESTNASLIVISQTSYPAWTAQVDGRPVRLWRANYAFQAVEMPPGHHFVELVYRDHMFRGGLAISALTLAGCGFLWWRARPGQRPAEAPVS